MASWNSLHSLEYVGRATGNHVFGAPQSFAFTSSTRFLGPRRGAADFATAAPGMNGVGAWGGVSGTGTRRPLSLVTPRARAVLAAAKPPKAPAPPRGRNNGNGDSNNGNSSGNGDSSNGDSNNGSSVGEGASAGPPLIAEGPPPATGVVGGGATSTPIGSSGSPAGAPEPVSLVLMGTGLAGLYRARRYLA